MLTIAFCVEDKTDEIIFQTLISRIMGEEIVPDATEYRRRRGGGWTEVMKHAHAYAQRAWTAQLDALFIAIDNDGTTQHSSTHSSSPMNDCRRCRLPVLAKATEILSRPRSTPFTILYGVPVQIIETWLLLARGFAFSGAPETYGIGPEDRKTLKAELYGESVPDRETMLRVAKPIVESADLA